MKSEETIYQDEETQIIDNETTNVEKTVKTEKKSNNGTWKKVIIGGVTGMVFGGASVFAANALNSDDVDDNDDDSNNSNNNSNNSNNEETPVSDESNVTVDNTIQVAQVSDDMSFGEAFATARAEVGAGGVFEWQGNVYATYYAEEWDSMSAEERAEFGSHMNYSGSSTSNNVADAEVVTDSDPVVIAEVVESETETEAEVNSAEVEHDYDVQIIGVSEEVLHDGSPVTVGHVQVDGEDMYYIDTNNDLVFDIAVMDINHDGTIGEGEVADVQDSGITVDVFDANSNMAMAQDQYLASNDAPDYIGDDCNLA